MDIITTSLDALLHKATKTHNQNVDTAALEAFCALINKEKDGPHVGAKLLANGIHSKDEIEALNILTVLDVCMKRCNNTFQSEIGKFRFLNEMIKLVSPKYLGTQTSLAIKRKVLQLLYIWTLDYPKETKIKEAYEMLKKQGVIREVPLSICADNVNIPERNRLSSSIFNDEEKNRLLQKLLQSKNPDDLQAANRLIKNMVKEDDKRAELTSRKITELESLNNSVRLLNEMLDSYKVEVSSRDELELIKELYQSCEKARPGIFKLIVESQQNEEILQEVLQTSDELGLVFEKYTNVIVKGNISNSNLKTSQDHSLLDLDSIVETASENNYGTADNVSKEERSEMDLLCDVFSSNTVVDNVLTPISSRKVEVRTVSEEANKDNKLKAFDDLNTLGEHLLNENLSFKRIGPQFNKISDKIPLNELAKNSTESKMLGNKKKLSNSTINDALNLDLNYLVDQDNRNDCGLPKSIDLSEDDLLVDITEEKINQKEIANGDDSKPSLAPLSKSSIKLSDIDIKLEDVKPSSMPPLVVLDEKNGITVTFHFGKNKPHQDVTVIVVTTISKNELPISNYLFQVVVPKACKFKLQKPSATELPAHNPFLPPSAITQVLLITNPEQQKMSLKFIVSHTMDDETFTEMGDVENFPVIQC